MLELPLERIEAVKDVYRTRWKRDRLSGRCAARQERIDAFPSVRAFLKALIPGRRRPRAAVHPTPVSSVSGEEALSCVT